MTVVSKDQVDEPTMILSVSLLQWVVLLLCAVGLLFGGCFIQYLG